MSPNDPCTIYQMAVSTCFDGEEPADEAGRAALVGGHEQGCPACRAFRQSLERLRRPLQDSRDAPLPAGLRDRLVTSPAAGPSVATGLDWLIGQIAFHSVLRPALAVAFVLGIIGVGLLVRPPRSIAPSLVQSRQASMKGSLLTLESKGEAVLKIPGGGMLRLWGGPGQVTVESPPGSGLAVTMNSGRLCCNWDPGVPVPLRFSFGPAHLEIVGTTWRATLQPDGGAILEMAEGKVRVTSAGKTTEVVALQQVRITAAGVVSPPEAFNPFVDPEMGLPPSQISIGER